MFLRYFLIKFYLLFVYNDIYMRNLPKNGRLLYKAGGPGTPTSYAMCKLF